MGHERAAEDLRSLTAAGPGVQVEVHLFANLADHGPPGARTGPIRVTVPVGSTLDVLLRRLGVPDDQPCLLLLNGQDVGPTASLGPGDVVSVLPPLAGG